MSRTNGEKGEHRWDLWRNEAHSGGRRGRPTGPWRACSGVARSCREGLGTKEDFSSREQPAQTTATNPAASEPEYVGELERLAQLRDQGILSDEEFEAKKKQILGI